MTRWRIELDGRARDLENLPWLFTAPELCVTETDGLYFLEIEELESFEDGPAVYAAASKHLPRLNGVAKLEDSGFQGVRLGLIHELDGDGHSRQHVVGVMGNLLPAMASLSGRGTSGDSVEAEPPAPGASDADRFMRIAPTNSEADRALELWGGPHEPFNLWKVWELVHDHSGLSISPKLASRFRRAMSDQSIAGEEARHEKAGRSVQRDPKAMTEAEAFLGDLLREWLRSLQ